MDIIYFGNSLQSWVTVLAGAVGIFIFLEIARLIVVKRLKIFAEKTETLVDDLACEILSATKTFFIAAVSLFIASFFLTISPEKRLLLHHSFVLICFFQAISWGSRSIAFWIEHYLKTRASAATSMGLISFAVKFGLYSLLTLLTIHNLGFDITTLIAGLGVGGIAVALAVQNILADLFASLTIILDKPFMIGDFIVVGDFMGTIEHIGLKTTRIRSLSGEQLIFANGDLLQSRVRNYKRMSERRVIFTLGVVYQTSSEQLEKIPKIIKDIIEKTPDTRFDRCHFLTFGASSLDFEVVYWVGSPDFNFYADVAQKINLDIFKKFNDEKIEFAYPSQSLFLQGELKSSKN